MAVARRTVQLAVDQTLIERARARSGRGSVGDDTHIVEEALAVYAGMRALDEAQAESTLSEEEAMRVAYELHALRHERASDE